MVPGAGTAVTFREYSVLSGPGATLPVGLLPTPQALLLLAGPESLGRGQLPCGSMRALRPIIRKAALFDRIFRT